MQNARCSRTSVAAASLSRSRQASLSRFLNSFVSCDWRGSGETRLIDPVTGNDMAPRIHNARRKALLYILCVYVFTFFSFEISHNEYNGKIFTANYAYIGVENVVKTTLRNIFLRKINLFHKAHFARNLHQIATVLKIRFLRCWWSFADSNGKRNIFFFFVTQFNREHNLSVAHDR
jgi:hypothetical protein